MSATYQVSEHYSEPRPHNVPSVNVLSLFTTDDEETPRAAR